MFIYSFVLLMVLTLTGTQIIPSKENQIKSVFLFNFAQFTDWASHRFPAPNAPLVIGVLGDDPFGDFLQQVVQGENIQGHPIELKRYSTTAEIGICHVLFVSGSKSHQVENILKDLEGSNILTVSDIPDFTLKGGVIKTYIEKSKLRFEVNMSAARKADLKLSSKLLRIADICCEGEN